MTDREKGDHWIQLASVLGAEIDEQAAVEEAQPVPREAEAAPTEKGSADERAVPAPSGPSTAPSPPKRPAQAAPPRRLPPTANWDVLASSLGIQPPPEPAAEPPKAAPLEQPGHATKQHVHEQVEERLGLPPSLATMSTKELAKTVESLSEGLKSAPASLEHEPTVVIVQETVAIFGAPDKASGDADGPVEGEEPVRDRPKRRRRRRSRTGDKSSLPDDSGTVPSEAAEMDEEGETAEEGETDEEAAGEAESDEKRRSKRRRPRRRRQKSEMPEAKDGPSPEVEPDRVDDDDELDLGDLQDSSDDRSGHRSIPAWQEAIGVIVEKNLESRAKRPDGGQSPRRGRRPSRRGGG